MRVATLLALVLAVVACDRPAPRSAPGRPAADATPARGEALPPLRLLDEAHAGELRRLFDEARDRTRLIVALSPT